MDVIYTMAPLAPSDEAAPALKRLTCGGVDVYAQAVSEDKYQVVQILSTDPADFLRPELSPGSLIER